MNGNSLAAAMALLFAFYRPADAGEQAPAEVPPVVPATDELPIRGVPAFPIHRELEQCLSDAEVRLGGATGTLHVRIGVTQRFSSPESGYILRADFTRADVSPPLINRIVCWHTGQLIASRISAQPLSVRDFGKALAIPHAPPPIH